MASNKIFDRIFIKKADKGSSIVIWNRVLEIRVLESS